jgi:hypothetical protein
VDVAVSASHAALQEEKAMTDGMEYMENSMVFRVPKKKARSARTSRANSPVMDTQPKYFASDWFEDVDENPIIRKNWADMVDDTDIGEVPPEWTSSPAIPPIPPRLEQSKEKDGFEALMDNVLSGLSPTTRNMVENRLKKVEILADSYPTSFESRNIDVANSMQHQAPKRHSDMANSPPRIPAEIKGKSRMEGERASAIKVDSHSKLGTFPVTGLGDT